MCIFATGAQRETRQTQRRRQDKDGAEIDDVSFENCRDVATSQRMLAATRSWKRQGVHSPQEPLEGIWVTPQFQPIEIDFGILNSITVGRHICFKSLL